MNAEYTSISQSVSYRALWRRGMLPILRYFYSKSVQSDRMQTTTKRLTHKSLLTPISKQSRDRTERALALKQNPGSRSKLVLVDPRVLVNGGCRCVFVLRVFRLGQCVQTRGICYSNPFAARKGLLSIHPCYESIKGDSASSVLVYYMQTNTHSHSYIHPPIHSHAHAR